MGEKSGSVPLEDITECDEPQSEHTTDNSKDYISCEEMSQEVHKRDENNIFDCANSVRQQKRKIISEDSEETDHFEDTESTPSFSSDDNKVHLKRAVNLEKRTFIDPKKMRLDFDRINELDKFKNIPPARSFFNHSLVPQAEDFKKSAFNYFQDSLPGPSDLLPRRKKKAKKPTAEVTEDDASAEEDVKAIADCLMENTLNVLDISAVPVYTDDVIEFNVMVPESLAYQGCENYQGFIVPSETIEESAMNLSDSQEKIQVSFEDPKTSDEKMEISYNWNADNTAGCDNPVSIITDTSPSMTEEPNEEEEEATLSVGRASREALRDPDSVPDLLEDFEIPPPVTEADNIVFDAMDFGNGAILIGIIPLENPSESQDVAFNGFPHWLLQILGTQVVAEEAINPTENAEEPHYYCQGDGLAVEADDDEEDDEGEEEDEASTETSSDNTAAEVDPALSSQEMSSLPEDSQTVTDTQELPAEEVGEDEALLSEQVEFFDTLSTSSDSGIGTSRNI